MGMRVLATLIITFVAILGSFVDAFYGLLGYAFWSYTYPEKATWGMLPLNRLSYAMGLVLLITTMIQKKRIFANNAKILPIVVFWMLCLISVFTAGLARASTWQFQYFTRVILITLIITLLVDDAKRFRHYAWAIVVCIGLIAAQSGIRGTLAGEVGGASKGFAGLIGDRNYMAILLCAIIPVVFYMGNAEKDKRLKMVLRFILAGDILALILTYSRAGFLGMAAIGVFMFLKAKQKILAGFAGIIMLVLFVNYVLPEQYLERLQTMKNIDLEAEDVDMSAASRLALWGSALEMILANPVFGVGFYNSEAVMGDYPDPRTGRSSPGRSIHNSLLQVGAEVGLPAFIVYVFIFSSIYRLLGKIKRKVRLGHLNEEIWEYASMLQVAFVGFFVSAFFANATFIDLSWHMVGLTIALDQIVKKDTAVQPQNA
jgi:probable O-glycosylation ligase (exosortase A-associated)